MTVPPVVRDPSPRLILFGPMRAEEACTEEARAEGGSLAHDIPAGNAQRLLAYLALHPRAAHRREALVDLLWADTPPDQARRALSDTIYRVRARGTCWLTTEGDTVALDAGLRCDVWEFDRLIAGGSSDDLVAAIELHRADLLPALYDDWVIGHRVARHQAYVAALASVIAERDQRGELPGALLLARQLVIAEPFDEHAHQAYLRLLGRLGRAGEALAHFDDLRTKLADELGTDPLPETVAIVQSIANERIVNQRNVGATRQQPPMTPFIGRVHERAAVLAAVDRALAGQGAIVGIEGPAGIGKSRLLEEVLAGAGWRGATAAAAGVSGAPEPSALAPLANAVAPLLRGPLLVHVEALLEPDVLALLGQIHPGWAARPSTERVLTDQAEARLAHALRALGAAIGSTGRVVVAIDDMHRATAALWHALDAFADGLTGTGGLLIISYRRPEVESTGGWALLQAWDRGGVARIVRLAPFGADEIAEMLADDGSDPERVLALTGGIPFYVRAWSEGGGDEGHAADALLDARLRRLPAVAREALECASVIGEDISYRLWLDVTGLAPMDLATTGAQLEAERWLTPSDVGYAFTHDIVRTAVYDLMDGEQRAAVHRRVADAVASRDPHNVRARAFHLDRGRRPREAAEMYIETGRRAWASLSFRESVDAFDRALALLPRNSALRLETALLLAEACEVVGDRERQRPVLQAVVAGARRRGDDASLLRALLVAGSAAARTDDPASGERLLVQAMAVATRQGDPLSIGLAEYRYADLMGQHGRWTEALETVTAAIVHAREAGDPSLLGGALRMRGIAARYTGDPAGSLRWLEEAVAVHRAAGDPLEELNSAANLTGAYYELCAWDALLALTDELLPVARTYGAPGIVGILLHQGGLAAMALGDPVTARARMVEARDVFAGAERHRLVGLVDNTIGLVAEDEGRLDEARQQYEAALAAADALDATTEAAYASHDLGALLIKIGAADRAVPLLGRAIEIWDRHDNLVALAKSRAYLALAELTLGRTGSASHLADLGLATLRTGFPPGEQAQGWLWTLYRVLAGLGRGDEARAVLIAADAELDRQAAAITDPERRRQFLERVPLNRAIVAEVATTEGRHTSGPTIVTVELARRDAPLGRTLRPDDRLVVDWTASAPEDATIADGQRRRQHRLARLLAEAAEAGAAPTDDDLARVLGVSRRTILRDMAAMSTDSAATTRRRLRAGRVTPG